MKGRKIEIDLDTLLLEVVLPACEFALPCLQADATVREGHGEWATAANREVKGMIPDVKGEKELSPK